LEKERTMKHAVAALTFAAIAIAGCQSDDTGYAPTASTTYGGDTLADLVGARGSSGEMELQSRGYQPARTEGLTTYWWNPGTSSCARVVTADGRYQSVDTVAPAQCQGSGASSTVAGGPPPDIADMVGARAGQAEMGMNSRGYAATRTSGLTSFWWNQSTGVCAQIVTSDGRYQSISAVAPNACAG
jgi:hypothetical protein